LGSDELAVPCIVCIVEGHGELESVPLLIRRIGSQLEPPLYPDVPRPIRVSKPALIHKDGELEKMIGLAARSVGQHGSILVLIDSDEDCPMDLSRRLHEQAVKARSDIPIAVVIAKREFEAWFIAAAPSLQGTNGLMSPLATPPDPESISNAKKWLEHHMHTGTYKETTHQARLAAKFDMEQARASRSFRKFYKEIVRLLS